MVLSKVLGCFLVLVAGLNCIKTVLGIHINDECFLKICTRKPQFVSSASSRIKISREDADTTNAMLSLQVLLPIDQSGFYCTSDDVEKYSWSIRCNCADEICRVTDIDFSNMNLRGSLPQSIEDLTQLTSLDLSGNQLSGQLPPSLVNLKQLSSLNLCNNNLEGPIPSFNGQNTELQGLYLCSNRFNGSIPEGLGELPSLKYLNLQMNSLNGTISAKIWNIKSLETLILGDNQFSDQIPQQMENLSNQLVHLSLMNNDFFGELPKSIGHLTNLKILRIQGSKLNGTIPDAIGGLKSLEILVLVGNNFKGPLPNTFSSTNQIYLVITDLVGDEKGYPFPDLQSLTNLKILILKNCSLIGPIPREIWSFQYLDYLDLSFNKLSGEIPLDLMSNQKLESIFLRSNKLNGTLPGWASNSNRFVDVSDNLFKNSAPLSMNYNITISKIRNLFACCSKSSDEKNKWLDINYRCSNDTSTNDHLYINCGGNETYIGGNYYEADLDPNGMSSFVLSNNSAWGYSSMGSSLSARKNKYLSNETCNVSMADAPLYTGARVAPVSLKYYGFCLKNDNYSVKLHFAEIGWDPSKFKKPQGRRIFNVDIQGRRKLQDFNIEEEAGGVYKNVTREFFTQVTENRLEIHLYWAGKGSMFVPLYYGPLISAISVSAVPISVPKNHPSKLSPASTGAIVGSSIVFVGLIIGLFWMLGVKKSDKGVELYPGGVYNFQEIKEATNNFDLTNKIGETGSVYKGVFQDGTEVAVKQLSVKSKQEVNEIIKEIGMIYALQLQHPNLAKPMGSCVKETQVLLVYEYMENLSLQHALFGTDDDVRLKLNWKTRFNICLGIAKGLAYLHEESNHNIIHSNIKPTNILLDKDFNVKISDFRYSEVHDAQPNKQDTTFRNIPRDKDTGHMAPEYMQGLPLTPKADVYSFGLVTLEIISGQPHILPKTRENICLINTAYKYYEEGTVEALIDRTLCEHKDYKYNEAVSVLHLAMQCVSPSFDRRPTMSEVVKSLEVKKNFIGKRINPLPAATPPQSFESGSTSQEGSSTTDII